MWLSDYVTRNSRCKSESSMGSITNSDACSVAVESALEHRDVPVVAPFGISYRPMKNEQSALIETNNKPICIGVVMKDAQLDEGEIMLYSSGGASIVLKNNGDVIINGKVFEKDGY